MNVPISSSFDACENDSAASAAAIAASAFAGREYLAGALSDAHAHDERAHSQEGSALLARLHPGSEHGMPHAQRCPRNRDTPRRQERILGVETDVQEPSGQVVSAGPSESQSGRTCRRGLPRRPNREGIPSRPADVIDHRSRALARSPCFGRMSDV
jgi:hypothetical protein